MPWFDRDDMERLMDWPQRMWSQMMRDVPSVEVADEGDALIVRVEAPGVDPDDLDVEVATQQVTVRGEIRQSHEGQSRAVYHSERRYGRFQRTIPLPQPVEPETAEASFRNGLLEIRLSRTNAGRRKLRIRTESKERPH